MLFGTAGIRGDLTEITPFFAHRLGVSVAEFSRRRGVSSVYVGRDGRSSSDMLSQAVAAGVLSRAVAVVDVGRVPTPVLAFACKGCGVMVTASHNPPENNGMKVFCNHRELYPREESEVEALMLTENSPLTWKLPSLKRADVLPAYEEGVLSYVQKEFGTIQSRKKVVVDCGNGVGALMTPHLLRKMGMEVITLFDQVSSHFERPSEPTERNVSALKERVVQEGADLGIAHDGDADRINVVDERGVLIPEDSLIAYFAGHYVRKGECVVTSIDTSFRIDEHVQKKGGYTKRVMLGNLHEGIAHFNAVFAGEPWKHIHVKFGTWIDGIISAAALSVLVQAREASALCSDIKNYSIEKINLRCEDRNAVLQAFSGRLREVKGIREILTISGVRANFTDGSWLLVRPSGTEPRVRVVMEGVTPHRFEMLKRFVEKTLHESKCLYTIVN